MRRPEANGAAASKTGRRTRGVADPNGRAWRARTCSSRNLAAGAEALAIFQGPHGYVSPSVYSGQPSVPTWHYVVVHTRGRARLVDEPGLRRILDDMVARFDWTGWRFDAPEDFVRA
jgi:predicted FMN-binding regulatory protein PaiB